MTDYPLSYAQLDVETVFVRPLLLRPPWRRSGDESREDSGVHALFRRYSPGTSPHPLTPEMRGAVWDRATFIPDSLRENEAKLVRAVDHAALMLHLLARGPASSAEGLDFGAACRHGGLTDARFMRLMGTPRSLRVESLSRVMQRLEKSGTALHWVSDDSELHSSGRKALITKMDEVWPFLNFLFGYDPDRSIARWAAGFFGMRSVEPEDSELSAASTVAD